jgi:hypothetical protein
MNPFCATCGFRISTECDCEIVLTEQGWAMADAHPWKDATRAGATRAAIDEAVAQSKAERDMVNHPPHYTQGAVECIDAIHAALGDDGLVAYCRGNAIKYLWRMGQKGDAVQDLEKAVWYITKAVEVQREAQ